MPSGIGTAGAGAELTSEQVARILVNPLQARSVVLAAGQPNAQHKKERLWAVRSYVGGRLLARQVK